MNGLCPLCGGASRNLIAPGYWECSSQRLITRLPSGEPIHEVCRHRYHDGTAAFSVLSLCEREPCGTGAIGVCSTCGRRVCGDHSRFDPAAGRRCVTCLLVAHQSLEEQGAQTRERERQRMAGWVEAVANTAASAVVALKSAGVPGYPAGTLNKVRSNPGVGVGARLRYVELKADHSPIWFLPSHGGLVWALSGLSEIIVWGYGYHSGDPRVVYVKTGSGSLLGSGRAPVIELGPGTNALPLDFEAMSETMLLNALGGKSSGRKAYVHQVAAKCLLGDLAGLRDYRKPLTCPDGLSLMNSDGNGYGLFYGTLPVVLETATR